MGAHPKHKHLLKDQEQPQPVRLPRPISATALTLTLVLTALVGSTPAYASQVQTCNVSPGSQCTLTFNLNNGDQASGSISITGGSGNDVNFWVTDPSGATVYNAGRVSGGTSFSFSASQSGAYILHFDNSFSIVSSKQVTVSYDVSSTLIPGASPGTSYAIVGVIVILVLIILYLAFRRGRRGKTTQTPQPAQPTG